MHYEVDMTFFSRLWLFLMKDTSQEKLTENRTSDSDHKTSTKKYHRQKKKKRQNWARRHITSKLILTLFTVNVDIVQVLFWLRTPGPGSRSLGRPEGAWARPRRRGGGASSDRGGAGARGTRTCSACVGRACSRARTALGPSRRSHGLGLCRRRT